MAHSGSVYESLAAGWLEDRGLTITGRNYRCKMGEIDLVALDGTTLVFVEVRARSRSRFATAAASVDHRKRHRLLRAAQHYLRCHPQAAVMPCRFDVIAIEPRQSLADTNVRWIRAAFTG